MRKRASLQTVKHVRPIDGAEAIEAIGILGWECVAKTLGIPFVPVLERGDSFSYSMANLPEKAKGRYRDHFPGAKESQEREGIVVRSICGSISFRAISNDFLLKAE